MTGVNDKCECEVSAEGYFLNRDVERHRNVFELRLQRKEDDLHVMGVFRG